MIIKTLLVVAAMAFSAMAYADDDVRYIEVIGTSEIEVIPDEIHYEITIKEYFKEEFDRWSKPEDYHTKVPLSQIESELREALAKSGIPASAVRTVEVGDTWRKEGRDFLVSKTFDVTLTDFNRIDSILKNIDTKGVNSMQIGRLENKNIAKYNEEGRIKALQAAKEKAKYLVESTGQALGAVLSIVEQPTSFHPYALAQSNVISSDAGNYETFRVMKRTYSLVVRFMIVWPKMQKYYEELE